MARAPFGLGALALVLAGCAGTPSSRATADRMRLAAPDAPDAGCRTGANVRVVLDDGAGDSAARAAVARALPRALERLATYDLALWCETTVVVVDTPERLAERTGQREPFLRAWTTFDDVVLLRPALWTHSDDDAIAARLAHELCHAAIAQAFGTAARARAAHVPRAFSEGVCSVVAAQGEARLPLHTLAHSAAPARAAELLADHAFSTDAELAYAAAFHVATRWFAQLGPGAAAQILAASVQDGGAHPVERAIAAQTGAPMDATLRDLLVATAAQP